jgi:hypothetical protein
MKYTFRPNLFIKAEALILEGTNLRQERNGRERKTIDLRAVSKLQEYSAGSFVDENEDQVLGRTCRLHPTGGWPLTFRSTSYLRPSLQTTPVVKDQRAEFRIFYRALLEQLASINPDLPVEHGNRGYAWMFIVIGVFTLLMFGTLGYFIVVSGNGDLTTRMIAGPIAGLAGIACCYFFCNIGRAYWPEKSTVRDVLRNF